MIEADQWFLEDGHWGQEMDEDKASCGMMKTFSIMTHGGYLGIHIIKLYTETDAFSWI